MKKITAMIISIILTVMLMASNAWAVAGSCVQTPYTYGPGSFVKVVFVCTGDSTDGSIPTQTVGSDIMDLITGFYWLASVKAYHTPGGTAPDAADVAVLMNGQDLLGGKGANLIHPTATYDVVPYSSFISSYRYPPITSTITVTVSNQATDSANYSIELIFSR